MTLVGRDREWATIRQWLAAPDRPLTLVGEPGVGTTALLSAATACARRAGHTVVDVQAAPSWAITPYASLRQLMRGVAVAVRGTAAVPAVAGKSVESAGEELLALLAAATGPVLIVADNMHWLDEPSRHAWATVAGRIGELPVAVLSAAHPVPWLSPAERLVVGPLDRACAGRLLDRAAPDLHPGVRQRILDDALGNPLAIVELAEAWHAADSPGVDLLRGLPPMTERLRAALVPALSTVELMALLVAALDFGGEVAEILAAAGLAAGSDLTCAVFDTAVAAGLVTLVDGRLRFASTLVRAAVVASAAPGRLLPAHTALELTSEHIPYRWAWHRAQTLTCQDEDVSTALEATVADCADPVEALRRLERAARLTPVPARRRRRLLSAVARAFELGRPELSEHLLAAAEQIQPAGHPRMQSHAVRLRFRAHPRPTWDPLPSLCAAARSLARDGDQDAALDVLVTAAYELWWADPAPVVCEQVVGVLRHVTVPGHDPRLAAVRAVAAPESRPADPPTAPDAGAEWLLGLAALARGDCPRAAGLLAGAAAGLRAGDRVGLLTHVQGLHAEAATAVGAWDAAAEAAAECLALARRTDQPVWQAQAHLCAALLAALRGDPDGAWRHAADAELAVTPDRFPVLSARTRLARAVAMLTTESYVDSYLALRRLFDRNDAYFSRRVAGHAVGYLAEAAARCGRHDEARAILDLRATTPVLAANLGYARALLANDTEAERLFDEARRGLSAWPWVTARVDLARGTWLRRRRRVVESRLPLLSALHVFDALGAVAWADRARAELSAAGAGAECDQRGAVVALTSQELQIARLAATGLSNRQIGQRLFLSHRTVGSHLYRIFPKLNVTSRTQLAARIRELGPPAGVR